MGLLDALFGRRKLPPSTTDKLGAISGAEFAIRSQLDVSPTGEGGLAVRPVAASMFRRAREQLEGMVRAAGSSLGSRTELLPDEFGFLWVLISDEHFPDVVATTQVAAQTIVEEGFRDQLLCVVFGFADAAGAPLDLVYAFKRGSFYAFAPRAGRTRDVSLEIRAHSLLQGELPLEKDMEYRYPMWGLPFGRRD